MTNDGIDVAFHGEYREIAPNAWLVCTELCDARPAAEALVTVTVTPAQGRTTLARLVHNDHMQDRDEHLRYR